MDIDPPCRYREILDSFRLRILCRLGANPFHPCVCGLALPARPTHGFVQMSGERNQHAEPTDHLGSDLPIDALSIKDDNNTATEQDIPRSSEQADSSGSDVPIDTPSTGSTKNASTEHEVPATSPPILLSEPVANRARDEYEIDFE